MASLRFSAPNREEQQDAPGAPVRVQRAQTQWAGWALRLCPEMQCPLGVGHSPGSGSLGRAGPRRMCPMWGGHGAGNLNLSPRMGSSPSRSED